MSRHHHWDHNRNTIRTRKGGWNIGKGVIDHHYSLLDELLGNISFFQLLLLHVTGRIPERRLAEWLEAIFMCMSWPEPRIWANQIGSLGGSAQTTSTAAICAGILASDSRAYGPGTFNATVSFIQQAMQEIDAGSSIKDFIENTCKIANRLVVPGFARPIAKGDERVIAMQTVEAKLKYIPGRYQTLGYQIHDYLYQQYGESINLSGYVAVFFLDRDFSKPEIERIMSLCVNAGVHACYTEAADRPPNSFLPLRCEDIVYTGHPERAVPSRNSA